MPELGVPGMPGLSDAVTSSFRRTLFAGNYQVLGQGRVLGSAITRDPSNVGYETQIQRGMLIGRSTANPLIYGSSVVGLTLAAVAAGGVTLTVAAATDGNGNQRGVIYEIQRRFGSSGTFKLTGPPTAAGVVATQTITFTGLNLTTGVITIAAASAAAVAGSLIQPADGTETILSFLDDGFPMNMSDTFGNPVDVELAQIPLDGQVDSEQLLNYPSDTSLRAWIKTALRLNTSLKFSDSF